MDVRDILKSRRLELGYTLEDLARKIGVSAATVSRWETGDIENMRRDKIVLLADALKISPSVVMGWKDRTPREAQLSDVYFSFAKNAQDQGIDPRDIEMAIEFIKKARNPEE